MKMKKWTLLMVLFWCSTPLWAGVKPSSIFGDNMVIQREKPVVVWGHADRGERITVSIAGQTASVRPDKNGRWKVSLPALQAGGPHELRIAGSKTTTVFKNVMVGEVWIASGQSNMEWLLRQLPYGEQEAAKANYPNVRMMTIGKDYSFAPLDEFNKPGTWMEAVGRNVLGFSAVAYHFSLHLHDSLGVPVGVIVSSWGGTVSEAWTSRAALEAFPQFRPYFAAPSFGPDFLASFDEMKQEPQMAAWKENTFMKLPSMQENWLNSPTDANWKPANMPGPWEGKHEELARFDGEVWYRCEFEVPANAVSRPAVLKLGAIDDYDMTWLNGRLIGESYSYSVNREYAIPAGVLKAGKNTLNVRVYDTGGGGGFETVLPSVVFTGGQAANITLSGPWFLRVGVTLSVGGGAFPAARRPGPNSFPSSLFNGMIHPMINLSVRGFIWYQGEGNAGRAYEYRELFPALIKDWRAQFGQGDLPFLWVQLANFKAVTEQPAQSDWAELREAQTMTLSLPQTGMACAIDIGEANDIHPKNKQDVGKRLALNALKVVYDKPVVHSGPTYKSHEVKGQEVHIRLENIGSGLVSGDKRYGYLRGFAVAGTDRKFHWAAARIEGNEVVVSSPAVALPVAVRYAWADNPDDANLYNREGLPAVPFRTDQWEGVTFGNKYQFQGLKK